MFISKSNIIDRVRNNSKVVEAKANCPSRKNQIQKTAKSEF